MFMCLNLGTDYVCLVTKVRQWRHLYIPTQIFGSLLFIISHHMHYNLSQATTKLKIFDKNFNMSQYIHISVIHTSNQFSLCYNTYNILWNLTFNQGYNWKKNATHTAGTVTKMLCKLFIRWAHHYFVKSLLSKNQWLLQYEDGLTHLHIILHT